MNDALERLREDARSVFSFLGVKSESLQAGFFVLFEIFRIIQPPMNPIQKLWDRRRNVAGRVLGYALGRSLQDGDSCTVQRIMTAVEKDSYRARTLIREIVLSTPFRNTQGGVVAMEPVISKTSLNISALNALKQDAASHNNQVKPEALAPKKK